MNGLFILLENGIAVPAPDLQTWVIGMENNDPGIRADVIGEVFISTVFLGLDHNLFGQGPPHLFETMIFGGEHHQKQWRYPTQADALEGHAHAIELVGKTIDA